MTIRPGLAFLGALAVAVAACAYDPYVRPAAGIDVAVTAGGPYVTPYFGVGFGVSGRRTPGLAPVQGAPDHPGPIFVTTEGGLEVRVDAARVAVAAATLATCEEGDAAAALDKLRTAEKEQEPRWVDLLALKEQQVAKLRLQPGEYCSVAVKAAPAGGNTLEMSGMVRQGAGEWVPFSISTAETVVTAKDLKGPLRLSADDRDASVHLRFEPARWFDGVDPAASPEENASTVLRNLAARPGDALTPQDGKQAALP